MTFIFFLLFMDFFLDFSWALPLFWNWIKIWGFLAPENGHETRSLFIRRMIHGWANWGEWPVLVFITLKYVLNFGSSIFQKKCIHSWFSIANSLYSLFSLNLTYPSNLYTARGTVHHIWLVLIWLVVPFWMSSTVISIAVNYFSVVSYTAKNFMQLRNSKWEMKFVTANILKSNYFS